MSAKRFGPLARSERLSDRVASAILDSILGGDLAPGDLLPTEMDLASQFGVSRTAVREAVRSLTGKGVVATGPGRRLVVAEADATTARETLSRFIQTAVGLDYMKVHEVRAAVEVEIAGLAAARAGEEDLRALTEACDGMERALGDNEAASTWDFAFHRVIAASTQNELFLVMIDAISEPLMQIRRMTFGPGGRARQALDSHRQILERVAAHDADGAKRAMIAHLDDVATFWSEHASSAEPSRWFPGPRDAASVAGA